LGEKELRCSRRMGAIICMRDKN